MADLLENMHGKIRVREQALSKNRQLIWQVITWAGQTRFGFRIKACLRHLNKLPGVIDGIEERFQNRLAPMLMSKAKTVVLKK